MGLPEPVLVFDPSVPVTDVQADLNFATIGYARSYGLAGRQGLMSVGFAYARGDIEGEVFEAARRIGRSGLGDMRARVSLNLLGPGAMTPGDATRRQDPLASVQGHASYTFKSRAWVAFDATWYGGGESTVDCGEPSARQSSTRFGGTVSIPIAPRQSIKIAASTGASARTGSDFNTALLAWQLTWFDRPPARQP